MKYRDNMTKEEMDRLMADVAALDAAYAAAAAHDARHLSARYRETDVLENLARWIRECQVADFDNFFRSHGFGVYSLK